MKAYGVGPSMLLYESKSIGLPCGRWLMISIKEELRKQFAKKAADLTDQLRRVEHQIGALLGSLSVGRTVTGCRRY
jgi:hypothetical protein